VASAAKTVIVTGASQGIGAAIAGAFLKRGYRVVATSLHITKSGAFPPGDNWALVDGDIGDPRTAARIAETELGEDI
jgi:NAD(P)-dependent dehydrogenase (short-subunit alcohol dehydrogenase family)